MNDQLQGSGPDIIERLGLARPKPKRRIRPWMWWAGAGALLVLFGVWFFFIRSGGQPVYTTQPVTQDSLTLTINATGTLQPRVQVDVGAEVSGRIDDLFVDFNDHVTKGQKLAQINIDQITAQLGQARATLQQTEATLAQAKATYRRSEALLKSKALSQQQYDTSQADYLRAEAGVALAAAQVQQYETQLTKATIYAPIDGVVLDRKVSRGQTVVAAFSTPILYTLASDLKQMELDVDIDEADVGTVRAGQAARFTVGAYPDKTFAARLISIHDASQTVQNVVTYKGVLLVDNSKLLLKPGMTATAEIITGKLPRTTLVPNAALRFVPPESATTGIAPGRTGASLGRVWTLQGGKLKPHDLKLGGTDGHVTQMIRGDLKPGDKVVTDAKLPGKP